MWHAPLVCEEPTNLIVMRAIRVGLSLLLVTRASALAVRGAMTAGFGAYGASLLSHPLETKLATAAVLAVAGDAIAQRRVDKPYDCARAASFLLFDMSYRGGFQHHTFPWIIECCTGDALLCAARWMPMLDCLGPTLLAALERTAFNQFVLVPLVYYPLFFAVTGAVQGLSARETVGRARSSFISLTLRNWLFWLPVQFVQFAFLGPKWHVPFVCGMGLVWNVILSTIAGSTSSTSAKPATKGVSIEVAHQGELDEAYARERQGGSSTIRPTISRCPPYAWVRP